MLWRALRHLPSGFYVDVGAQDPVVDSVSKAFYDAGWRGAHVEPVAEYAELLRKARPDEQVFQVALGVKAGTQKFFVVPNTGLSTSIKSIAERHRNEQKYAVTEIRVPCLTLDQVFEAINRPEIHWLKIDVEGAEREVLSGWNAKRFRPWIIVVEATLPNSTIENFEQWEHLVLDADYRLVYQDGLNRFYISAEHAAELAPSFKTPPNVFDEVASSGKGGYWGAYLNATFAEQERLQHVKFQEELAVLAERERSQLAAAQSEISSLTGRLLQSDHTRVVVESSLEGRLAESKLQVDTLGEKLVACERQLEIAGARHKSLDERASLAEQQLAIKDQAVEQSVAEAREKLGVAEALAQAEMQARSILTAQYAIQHERLDAAEKLSASHHRTLLKREAAITVLDEKVAELLVTVQRNLESQEKLSVELSSKAEKLAAATRLCEMLDDKLTRRDHDVAELTRLLGDAQQASATRYEAYESLLRDAQQASEKRNAAYESLLLGAQKASETRTAAHESLLRDEQQASAARNAAQESLLKDLAGALNRVQDKWEVESKRAQGVISDLNSQRESMQLRYDEQVASAHSQALAFESQRQALIESLADCRTRLQAATLSHDQILASRSWKLTAPFRRLAGPFAKLPSEK